MRRTRLTATPAMIVAAVALFVALGGGAYAGVALNEVRSANIKNGEVKTVNLADSAVSPFKLKNNAVSSVKVRNGSLRASDLSAAARATLQGQAGPAGPAGPPGPASAPHLLTAESNPLVDLEDCGGDLLDCPNLLTLALNTPVEPVPGGGPPGPASDIPKRDWLVQAKLVVVGQDLPDDERNDCGLVIDGSTERSGVLDIAQSRLSFEFTPGEFETVALMAAVPKRLKNPRIALRCTSLQFQDSEVSDLKITALEVGDITAAG